MRLLSLNVGQPRVVPWQGRTVRTSIWKSPVAGRRHVSRLNVDGDAQADLVGHGGEHRAVYVYDESAYRHWSRELGRDDLVPTLRLLGGLTEALDQLGEIDASAITDGEAYSLARRLREAADALTRRRRR